MRATKSLENSFREVKFRDLPEYQTIINAIKNYKEAVVKRLIEYKSNK